MSKVKINPRKKRRERNNALGKDILRYITELVTNSDDSYKRLESNGIQNNDNIISIRLEKEKRSGGGYVLSVIDHAEGMSGQTMLDIFTDYAGDNAKGTESGSRGIFGQGASDVLQAAASEKKTAMIESFKDGKGSRLYYNIDENEDGDVVVKPIDVQGNQLKQVRNSLGIPENGTKVSFGIPSYVTFNNRIIKNLPDMIERIASLRYLLSQEKRIVKYFYNGKEQVLSSKKYLFNEQNEILKKNFSIHYEDNEYNCELVLYKNDNKSNDGTHIIVRDEHYTVFDNTMFDFKNSVGAQNISGELVINGFYELCKSHLNRETQADTIVFDNRTGFDTRHEFYEILNKKIHPVLEEVINNQNKNDKSVMLENNSRINNTLKIINKYLYKELKDVIPGGRGNKVKTAPNEGILFARNQITITKGKKYDLQIYINTSIISSNEDIEIVVDNSDYLEVSPLVVNYDERDIIEDNLVIKNITIEGLEITNDSIKIQAKVGTRVSNVLVDVIEEDIHYPKDGLDFYPSNISLVVDKPHTCKLFVDTEIIPLESKIILLCDGLELNQNEFSVEREMLLNKQIACINVKSIGGLSGESYEIVAKSGEYEGVCRINIVDANRNDNNSGGYIAGIHLKAVKGYFQSYVDDGDHIMYINKINPINTRIMGDMESLDPNNPRFNKEQTKYLCDILAMQTAKFLVGQQAKNGDFDEDDIEEAADSILNEIQKHKNKLYVEIFPSMMGIAEENES